MKHFICALLASIALIVSRSGANADLLPLVLEDKDTVQEMLDRQNAAFAALIEKAGEEGRVTIAAGFQHARSFLDNMGIVYVDAMTATFQELSEKQKQAFRDANQLLENVNYMIDNPDAAPLQTLEKVTVMASDVFSWSKKPMVTSYSPHYVPPAQVKDIVAVHVSGLRLHARGVADPVLRIDGKEYEADSVGDSQILFNLPRNAFPQQERGTSEKSVRLVLFREPDGWRGWVPFWPDDEIEFRLAFQVLPQAAGTWKLETVFIDQVPETKSITSEALVAESQGYEGKAERCDPPKDGYVFVLDTIQLHVKKWSDLRGETSPGNNIGTVRIDESRKTEKNICLVVTAYVGCKPRCWGKTSGYYTVDMVRHIGTPRKLVTAGALDWMGDTAIDTNTGAYSQMLEITLFNMLKRSVPARSPDRLPFLEIRSEPQDHKVLLRPVWDVR